MQRRGAVDTTPMNSVAALLIVGIILLGLTVTTVFLAHVNLHGWNTPVALAIAATKGTLIVVFFMHGRFAMPIARLVMVAALLWLAILLSGTADDILTRQWLAIPGK